MEPKQRQAPAAIAHQTSRQSSQMSAVNMGQGMIVLTKINNSDAGRQTASPDNMQNHEPHSSMHPMSFKDFIEAQTSTRKAKGLFKASDSVLSASQNRIPAQSKSIISTGERRSSNFKTYQNQQYLNVNHQGHVSSEQLAPPPVTAESKIEFKKQVKDAFANAKLHAMTHHRQQNSFGGDAHDSSGSTQSDYQDSGQNLTKLSNREITKYQVRSQEEAEKLSQILHGHQDLTEPFLGTSKKVQTLKKRLEQAKVQRQSSVEQEKLRQVQGKRPMRSISSRQSSHQSRQDSVQSKNETKPDQSPHLDSTMKILQSTDQQVKQAHLLQTKQRFQPTSSQNWEKSSLYSEELKIKAKQRMERLQSLQKASSNKSPMLDSHRNGMSTFNVEKGSSSVLRNQKHEGGSMAEDAANSPRPAPATSGVKQRASKPSKAFYLYDLQMQKKRQQQAQNSQGLPHSQSASNPQNFSGSRQPGKTSKKFGGPDDEEMNYIDSQMINAQGKIGALDAGQTKGIRQILSHLKQPQLANQDLSCITSPSHLQSSLSEDGYGGLFESSHVFHNMQALNQNHHYQSKTNANTNQKSGTGALKLDQVLLIQQAQGATCNEQKYQMPPEEVKDETRMPQYTSQLTKQTFASMGTSRTTSSVQKKQILEEIGAMQQYGDLAMAEKLSTNPSKQNTMIKSPAAAAAVHEKPDSQTRFSVSVTKLTPSRDKFANQQFPQQQQPGEQVIEAMFVMEGSIKYSNKPSQDETRHMSRQETETLPAFEGAIAGITPERQHEESNAAFDQQHALQVLDEEEARNKEVESGAAQIHQVMGEQPADGFQGQQVIGRNKIQIESVDSILSDAALFKGLPSTGSRQEQEHKTTQEDQNQNQDQQQQVFGEDNGDMSHIRLDQELIEELQQYQQIETGSIQTQLIGTTVKTQNQSKENSENGGGCQSRELLLMQHKLADYSPDDNLVYGNVNLVQTDSPPKNVEISSKLKREQMNRTIGYKNAYEDDITERDSPQRKSSQHFQVTKVKNLSNMNVQRIKSNEMQTHLIHQGSEDRKHDMNNNNYYKMTMRKSFGDNHSMGTELLSKVDKIDQNNDYFPKTMVINGSEGDGETTSKNEDKTSNERGSIGDGAQHFNSKFEQEQQQIEVTKVESIRTIKNPNASRVDLGTQMSSQQTITAKEPKQSVKKISAFKLPLSQGKGDLLPALEKDMQEPGLSFQNLSKLFNEKQKEKFYAKNSQIAQKILNKVGKASQKSLTKRSVEMIKPAQVIAVGEKQLINLDLVELRQIKENDYFDKAIKMREEGSGVDLTMKDQLRSQQQIQRNRMGNHSSEQFFGTYNPSLPQMASFRDDERLGLEPSLPLVKEKRALTKHQRKLNALMNLKFEIQRKTELSSMVHLTRPLQTQVDSTIESTERTFRVANELSVIGNSRDKKLPRFSGSKLFHTTERRMEEQQQHLPPASRETHNNSDQLMRETAGGLTDASHNMSSGFHLDNKLSSDGQHLKAIAQKQNHSSRISQLHSLPPAQMKVHLHSQHSKHQTQRISGGGASQGPNQFKKAFRQNTLSYPHQHRAAAHDINGSQGGSVTLQRIKQQVQSTSEFPSSRFATKYQNSFDHSEEMLSQQQQSSQMILKTQSTINEEQQTLVKKDKDELINIHVQPVSIISRKSSNEHIDRLPPATQQKGGNLIGRIDHQHHHHQRSSSIIVAQQLQQQSQVLSNTARQSLDRNKQSIPISQFPILVVEKSESLAQNQQLKSYRQRQLNMKSKRNSHQAASNTLIMLNKPME